MDVFLLDGNTSNPTITKRRKADGVPIIDLWMRGETDAQNSPTVSTVPRAAIRSARA